MQTHPTPSAHACTTLPPGNLPLLGLGSKLYGPMCLRSQCGRLTRHVAPVHRRSVLAPTGTWNCSEIRIDDAGTEWIKADRNGIDTYLVIDNYGDLVEVRRPWGAA